MEINPNPRFLSERDESQSYRAIARVALFWGPVELQLEGILTLLRARHKANGPFPASFSRKVDELKDRLKAEDALSELRAFMRPNLSEAKRLHIIRVHVVHSYFQGQLGNGKLLFGRSENKAGVAYRESRYSIAELEAATCAMIAVHNELAKVRIPLNREGHFQSFFLR